MPGAGYGGGEADLSGSALVGMRPPWSAPRRPVAERPALASEGPPWWQPQAKRGPALPIGAKRGYSDGVLRRSRQRCAALVIGVALALAAGAASAQSADGDGPSLEQLVRAAMVRDDTLAQRQLQVRNRQLDVAARAAGNSFGLDLSISPSAGTSWDFSEDGEFGLNYNIGATIKADLPHPFGSISTTASLDCNRVGDDLSTCKADERNAVEDWDNEDIGSIDLDSEVKQPLKPLLGLDAELGGDLEAAHGVVQAERNARARVRGITREILQSMKQILQHRQDARNSGHEIAELEDKVARRRDLFQDNQQSHSFQKLLFNLEKERRALDTTQRRLDQDLDAFEQRTGARRFGLLTEALLALPGADTVEHAPAVVDAVVDLRVGEHRIREDGNSRWPEVNVNASYDWRENKLEAGIGFELTLQILDGGQQQIKTERLNNDVESAKLEGASARREFAEELIALERKVHDLDYRSWEHREETRLAALNVVETQAALDAGIVVPSDLAQAELAHELLAMDGEILRVDRWLLKLDIDALTDADPLDFSATR